MKSLLSLWTAVALMLFTALFPASADQVIRINEDLEPMTKEETLEMLLSVTDEYLSGAELAAELKGELTEEEIPNPFSEDGEDTIASCTLTHQGRTMRFLADVIGEPGENGLYPLYITLHGGGESEPEANDERWMSMFDYYREAVESGIYIACRGITDTWDLHFQPASYMLYDRLIQAMICLYQADPDRVYLLGFSAGGDGVYQIAPRMADRFAAANMSSGHPNGVCLLNLANCPFSIQAGVRDYYSESALRCVRAAEFEQVLNGLRDRIGCGYEHQVLIHVPEGHNYEDWADTESEVLADPAAYADPEIVEPMMVRFIQAMKSVFGAGDVDSLSYLSAGVSGAFDEAVRRIVEEEFGLELRSVDANAVHYVSGFTRDPAPRVVVWDLSTRAPEREVNSFYWLKADDSVTQGTIVARMDDEENTLTVNAENVNGDFSILVNPALMDVSRPLGIITPEGRFEVYVNPSRETALASMQETGDPALAWVAEIPCSLLHEGGAGR